MDDLRVPFWGPVKYVARLRDRSEDSTILLNILEGGGHFGPEEDDGESDQVQN